MPVVLIIIILFINYAADGLLKIVQNNVYDDDVMTICNNNAHCNIIEFHVLKTLENVCNYKKILTT